MRANPPGSLVLHRQASPMPRNQPATPRRGFTLIEVLVVIAIVVVLVAMLFSRVRQGP